MYIILGATGHIGSSVVKGLVEKGQPVIAVTSNPDHVKQIEKMGATAALADVAKTSTLTELFRKGTRLYLLNPPAPVDRDPSEIENRNIDNIIESIQKASFEKIVGQSTYGAQPGKRLGDLDVLYNMEQKLQEASPGSSIIRGAYYYSNWEMSVRSARNDGKVYSLYPPGFKLPMVAPADIAGLVVDELMSPSADNKLTCMEGPERYSPNDVARAFSEALHKRVQAVAIRQDDWVPFLQKAGFSPRAAESMANMTKATVESAERFPENFERGETTLTEYISQLVKK